MLKVWEGVIGGRFGCLVSVKGSSTLIFLCFFFCTSIPSLLPTIQERLRESISTVLSRSHHLQARPATTVRANVVNAPLPVSDAAGPALVQLALQTLARFNFQVFSQLVVRYFFFLSLRVQCGFYSLCLF